MRSQLFPVKVHVEGLWRAETISVSLTLYWSDGHTGSSWAAPWDFNSTICCTWAELTKRCRGWEWWLNSQRSSSNVWTRDRVDILELNERFVYKKNLVRVRRKNSLLTGSNMQQIQALLVGRGEEMRIKQPCDFRASLQHKYYLCRCFQRGSWAAFQKKPFKLRLRGAGGFVSMPALLVLAL